MIGCSNPPHPTPENAITGETSILKPVTTDSLNAQIRLLFDEFTRSNTDQDNRLKMIDDRTKYLDSAYFELVSQFNRLQDDVKTLKQNIIANTEIKSNLSSGLSTARLSEEEFRSRYIDALASYQNGNYDTSLRSFSDLLLIDKTNELSDNCQYWIGEIYYAQKEFRKALAAFKKTLEFPSTNKADHAQYKIGLCYLNIGDTRSAIDALNKHITDYPNSEHYKSSVDYINKYK